MSMIYFRFDFEKPKSEENNPLWATVLSRILTIVLPKANPTLEKCVEKVCTWYVEYDTSGNFVNREMGVDAGGKIVFKAPLEGNLGYWVDNSLTLNDFKCFHPVNLLADEFEELWKFHRNSNC